MTEFIINLLFDSFNRSFLFFLGLCLGSFLNVLIYRLPRGLQVIHGRSFCPQCKKKISWFDNLPLVSFILLKGKCRYCHKPISWRYPLVELFTGVSTVVSLQPSVFSHQFSVLCSLFFIWSLIVIFFTDLEQQIIPDEIIIPNVILIFILLISQYPNILISNTLVSIISAGFFLALHLLTKGKGMGLGDAKLAFLIGLFFGYPRAIMALYLAFLTGAIGGVILILLRKKRFGQHIPFGPFLTGAAWVTLIWGNEILKLWQRNFILVLP